MKKVLYLLLIALLQSCFPVSIAPNLEKGQLFEARKFKKQLPNQYSYIFTDPKDAHEFYYFISSKFPSNEDGDSETNVPVFIKDRQYFVTFYETEKSSKAVNLLPMFTNGVLEKNNIPVRTDQPFILRDGTWYIALIITDEDYNDALSPSYTHHNDVMQFSRSLQNEYFITNNYNSLLLKDSK